MRPIVVPALVAIALLFGGCSTHPRPRVSLAVSPEKDLGYDSTGRTVFVAEPTDRRPQEEIEGDEPGLRSVVPIILGVVNIIYTTKRGNEVTGNERFSEGALREVHRSLSDFVRSTGLFADVRPAKPADYVLETEVLHLAGRRYEARYRAPGFILIVVPVGGFIGGAEFGRGEVEFLSHATAALRLRLRDGSGRLVGESVVTNAVLGHPDQERPEKLVPDALRGSLARARALVASWVLEDAHRNEQGPELARFCDEDHRKGHTFLAHAVDQDRTGVVFAEIACPSGKVRRTRRVDGVPLVGRPGEWLVSPLDENGVRYPTPVYDGLTRHLSRYFVLHRTDELAVYHYFGRRQ